MATKKNPANENRALAVYQQGVVGYDKYTFDLAASYATGAGADETLILIGYIPADCVMIPHLSRLYIPELDTNGAPTGDHEVGTAADPDALLASVASETAATTYTGEDLLQPTAIVGSPTADTAIYIRVSSVIATLGTGVIVFEPAYRAYRADLDA